MLANDNKDCLNVRFFNIFFKPETELVVALAMLVVASLVSSIYRPRDIYESDSSPCGHDQLNNDVGNTVVVSICVICK
jgi:hypothetical protein